MGFFFINIKTRSKKDGDLYMRDALREMVKNLAFERFKKEGSNEEYVRFRSNMKTNKKDIKTNDSDYMIDSKPIDEYVDDIYTVIDLALEEERLEILIWVTIVAVLLTITVTLFILLKTPLLELI